MTLAYRLAPRTTLACALTRSRVGRVAKNGPHGGFFVLSFENGPRSNTECQVGLNGSERGGRGNGTAEPWREQRRSRTFTWHCGLLFGIVAQSLPFLCTTMAFFSYFMARSHSLSLSQSVITRNLIGDAQPCYADLSSESMTPTPVTPLHFNIQHITGRTSCAFLCCCILASK